MIRTIPLLVIVLLLANNLQAQNNIKGSITEHISGEPVLFANIKVYRNGTFITGTATDENGNFELQHLDPGNYDLDISHIAYKNLKYTNVEVSSVGEARVNIKLKSGTDMDVYEFVEHVVPIFTSGEADDHVVNDKVIEKLPGTTIADVMKTAPNMGYQDDGKDEFNVNATRSNATRYVVNGMLMWGTPRLPKSAIQELAVMSSGLSARYGDVTGAVINLTTKSGASKLQGSFDYLSSGYKLGEKVYGLDAFAHNQLEFSLLGPLLKKNDSTTIASFFVGGNLRHQVDPQPSILGTWSVKDEKLAELRDEPLRFDQETGGTILNHEFLRLSDLEKSKTRQDVAAKGANIVTKIDFKTSPTTTLSLGGLLDLNQSRNDFYRSTSGNIITGNLFHNTLMNTSANPDLYNNSWQAYMKFRHDFVDTSRNKMGNIDAAYYTIQLSYQQRNRGRQDFRHRDRLFDYGYVGKFKTYQRRTYAAGFDSLLQTNGLIHQTFEDTLVTFEASDINEDMARITESYYQLYGYEGFDENGNVIYNRDLAKDALKNLDNLQQGGALRNGDEVFNGRGVYSMWRTPANVYQDYQNSRENQFRISANGYLKIKDHTINVGLEYEQRNQRAYQVNQPRRLWEIGRQLMNNHITNLDISNPIVEYVFDQPTIDYNRLNASPGEYMGQIDPNEFQSFFDYNVRKNLGLDPDGVDYVDFDNYDPKTYSISYFSADELLNNGSSLVSYYGYDHHGNKIKKYDSNWLSDFFTKTDEFGNFQRAIAPYRPIYTAAYIEDKISMKDLIVRVGLRIDRFDANQSVIADPYVLFPTVKAGDDLSPYIDSDANIRIPENIGSDYVVYVNDLQNPTSIVGFRDGHTWYNAEGSEIQDASILETASGIAPLLVDNSKTRGQDIDASSFKDYKPQIKVMPRISFAFPITDKAEFFAHYDILTKRPSAGARLNPVNFYFIESIGANPISHGNLKPEQTIDYEIGFKQKLNPFSAMTISGYYREMRNLVNVMNLTQAFPNAYITYENLDFATAKGFTFSYDLRAKKNFSANVSYTLQFAEGTGSSETSGLGLARTGKPNLRTNVPLSFDQRHAISGYVDYRYEEGKEYNGPVLNINGKKVKLFANMGTAITMNMSSGRPYTAGANVSSTGLFSSQRPIVDGSINGSRLPWQFLFSNTIDRRIKLKGKDNKTLNEAVIYLQIDNIFNMKNIISVYQFTGNPDDDGYLTEATFQNDINSQTDTDSFRELYQLKVNNGAMYALPRRMKLGFRFNF
ncbi:MAG: carboxypeptidase regulatory-like domain-containing protein [Flavobacteriales bacterium]|nr:carboxypeptidase regulatory-like domain-containing protein [Flavobacteriales bacterium]